MHRSCGILLHPTSLPGPHPVGDFGQGAIQFIDFLADSGQSVWQILPLGPTGYGFSPYNTLSAFAGNPVLIDLNQLTEFGELEADIISEAFSLVNSNDFIQTHVIKSQLLQQAGCIFFGENKSHRYKSFIEFCCRHADWLDDFALYMAIKDHFNGQPWSQWPVQLKERDTKTLDHWRNKLQHDYQLYQYQQYLFHSQYMRVKKYANLRGIEIFGDMPIFVALDSADVWANQHLFRLDDHGNPLVVAGVPPDYFSKTGQRWGNPLYAWDIHTADNYTWWLKRVANQLEYCDLLRIDHFRGFESCWVIPAQEKTAVNGQWEEVPGQQLFTTLKQHFSDLPIVAEDLGIITKDVEKLRDDMNFPGMKILQFAFDSGADNPYLPENYSRNCVVYTGTHDNNTTLGWWRNLDKGQKDIIRRYFDKNRPEIPMDFIKLAMSSVADLCIIPCQDILELGTEARFNTPGRANGNWQWQMSYEQLTENLATTLQKMVMQFNR